MNLNITNINKYHKASIHRLIEKINKHDNLNYSLTDEWLDYTVENASESVFLGFYDEKLVGLATSMINSVYSDQAALNVVVTPEYRNKGLGSLLYNEVYEFAKIKDVKIVEAYVKQRLTHGVGFAKKKGFMTSMYSWEMELHLDSIDFSFNMGAGLNFRKAKEEDGFNYKRIINDVFGDELGEDALIQTLRDPSIGIYILEKEGQAIGSATVQIRKDLSLAYIYDIAILSDHRGRGLGSKMIESCLRALKEEKIDKASLQVTGENKGALKLYKRIGFREVDIDFIMTKEI